jgi:putative endonuclease
LYTGITTDVKRRFKEHNTQGPKCAKSLRGKTPLRLVFFQQIGHKSEALKLEYRIKQLTKLDKESLIKTKKLPKIAEI